MVYENDRLNIPKKYQQMSVSELRKEKEKVLKQSTRRTTSNTVRKKTERKGLIFN